MLDASQGTLSPVRRVLKRSASTASLPTPPRTYRKRGRGRSRGSCDSSSESEVDEHAIPTSEDDDLPRGRPELNANKNKKRKTGSIQTADDDQEAAFWMGSGNASSSKVDDKPTGPLSQAPLLYRRLRSQSNAQAQAQLDQALVSPPPSHRKPMNPPAVVATSPSPATTSSAPVTPKPRSSTRLSKKTAGTVRASPANPFLATPFDKDQIVESSDDLDSEASPGPKTPHYDKPTVTYVFRGVRRVYQNPMYNHAKGKPLSPPPNSQLPVTDPLFSPDPTCRPMLLFPEAHRSRKNAKNAKNKGKASSAKTLRAGESDGQASKVAGNRREMSLSADNDDDLNNGKIKRPDFRAAGAAGGLTLEEELRDAESKNTVGLDPFC